MKAQILKIAGVKTEKEFYKKFPSEEAFMKKHGKELKKAQVGTSIDAATKPVPVKPINFGDMYAEAEANNMGISLQEKQRREALAATAASKQSAEPSGMAGMIGGAMKALGGDNGDIIGNVAGMFERGGRLPMAVDGWTDTLTGFGWDTAKGNPTGATYTDSLTTGTGIGGGGIDTPSVSFGDKLKGSGNALLGQAGSIIGNIEAIGQMQKEQDKQKQFAKISDVTAQAAESQDIDAKRQKRYLRPEDMAFQPGEMGNPYGQGTNYLAARNGAELANTFAPNTIYTDMGYEPLNDSNVKQYQWGGIASGLGSWVTGGGFQESPEGKIGSIAGKTIGSLIPIPGASIIGEAVGGLAGGLFGGSRQNETNNYAEQGKQNTMRAAGAGVGKAARGMYSGSLEDGGWVSNDWMPQVIAKFGEYDVKDLLKPPHDADMLRAGGHLKEYTPPSARAMFTGRTMDEGGVMHSTNMMFDTDHYPRAEYGTQMAMGGDLQVHRGEAETMSYNPYLPDGGETVMFRGPSHDNGGMPISFGQNGVEVEGGEPAIKMQDGGEQENLVVYGNMLIPNYGVSEIGDPKAKGKKFKNYVADLSKIEARQNKIVSKSTDVINSLDINDPFTKLTFAANQANILGANMKLKEIADKKMSTAAVQNAILDTAEEHGLVSDALAKGKIVKDKEAMKKAKFGAKMEVAQNGLNATGLYEAQQAQTNMINNWPNQPILNTIQTPPIPLDYTEQYQEMQNQQDLIGGWPRPANSKQAIAGLLDLLGAKGIDTSITSGYRAGAKTKQGNKSRHATNEAVDVKFPALGKSAYEAMLGDQDIVAYMLSNNLTAINEYNPNIAKKTGATGPHIHIGMDAGTKTSDAFRKAAAERHPEVVQQVMGSASPSRGGLGYAPISGTSAPTATPGTTPTATAASPATKGLPQLPEKDVKYLQDLYAKAQKAGKGPEVLKFQQEYHRLAPEYAKSVIGNDPLTNYAKKKGYSIGDLRGNEDALFGQRTKDYNTAIASAATPELKPIAPKEIKPLATGLSTLLPNMQQPLVPAKPNHWGNALNFAESLMPWLTPTNQQGLDPQQLSGEMLALASNQVAPVQAQLLQPLLEQPYDISLQDQLNANQADFNALQRQTGYNPEALSALAAQKYAANSQVLGNQFRANQEMKAGVYNKNREILNQTQAQNLGILDQQYTRQEQAKSNTKAQAIAALNSINDKIAKNKLENRKLGIYENMYGYRFGPNGQAYNVNGPAPLNFSGNPVASKGQLAPGRKFSYDENRQIIGTYVDSKDKTNTSNNVDPLGLLEGKNGKKLNKKGPNSNIVKAIKGL
jgi:hypothetical protein